MLRRLALIDAAQHGGFTLDKIRDLVGSDDRPAHERLRQLAQIKLPEVNGLVERATAVRDFRQMCSNCACQSLDVCGPFDDRLTQLHDRDGARTVARVIAIGESSSRLSTSGRTNYSEPSR